MGIFVIILDAIDEVSPKFRGTLVSQLVSFINDYPRCGLIISTRPDDLIETLPQTSVVRTCPLSKEQIISVIEKIDYSDNEVKSRFLELMKAGLFETHRKLLSNPLHVTVMFFDIPLYSWHTIEASFYRQAFEALFQTHDAAKGTYRREQHARLPFEDLERVFSVFCYSTFRGWEIRVINV